MDPVLDVISTSLFFHDLPEEYQIRFREIIELKAVKKGEVIFLEGDDSDGFYLVINGKIKIYKISSEGKEKILHIFSSGEPFGEVAMFSGKQFPAAAEALIKSQIGFFPKKAFVNLIKEYPTMALSMMGILSSRLKQFASQIENLSLKDVPARLAGYLLYLAEEQETTHLVCLNITKGQLASILGTIPETLSRMMSKMSQQGLIKVNGRDIEILNLEGLRNLLKNGRFFE